MLLQRVKYLVNSPMKYGLFRQQASSLPKMAVYSTPGNQATPVVSSFGLCAGLLRQREFPAHGFVRSQNIIPVVNAVNGMALNFEIADSLGGKYLMEVMSKCQSRIAELDHEIRELERSHSYLNSFMPCYPPLAASSPSSLNNECYRDSRDISSFSSPCSTSGPYSISGP